MSNILNILELYSNVLDDYCATYGITKTDIGNAIQNMNKTYSLSQSKLNSTTNYIVDYDDVAHRCAYLHKYTFLHTAMVWDVMSKTIDSKSSIWSFLYDYPLKVCSLGAGPGNDIIAVIAALHSRFGFLPVSATLIDCINQWEDTFRSLTEELLLGDYGTIGLNFSPEYLEWTYLCNNLLGKMSREVNKAIGTASLVTMVKFVSATACKDTATMIKKIFNVVKPGAMVLYIDNAAGGFHQLVANAAEECHFVSVFGPFNHKYHVNKAFSVKLFGYTSCYQTTVTFHLLQKATCSNRITSNVTPSNLAPSRMNVQAQNSTRILSEEILEYSVSWTSDPELTTTRTQTAVTPSKLLADKNHRMLPEIHSKYNSIAERTAGYITGAKPEITKDIPSISDYKLAVAQSSEFCEFRLGYKESYYEDLDKNLVLENCLDSHRAFSLPRELSKEENDVDVMTDAIIRSESKTHEKSILVNETSMNYSVQGILDYNRKSKQDAETQTVHFENNRKKNADTQTPDNWDENSSVSDERESIFWARVRAMINEEKPYAETSHGRNLTSIYPQNNFTSCSSLEDTQNESGCCCVIL